ncbi:tyrosine-type recombinase/integrase [Listeria monocytogenes]|uniref:tyrosine-type recombinase/integrase n=1 Tax=Listeria monocytogenes TaxID=1639 RepID=UPI000874F203|nr:site-specific integrase [Listeria monocytogenes]EAC8350586.1 site-specific integrase [Listeria monocytogenes]EAD0739976.1 site-specific integrase [Listeria monocytogenes]EAD9140337.1 site-specific integrase [Listeria monocytogenes]EJC6459527.1 site-specific integrase [Listeria monocytogenes]MBC6364000.1 site-specific integrase [Listeria monocytogenes]
MKITKNKEGMYCSTVGVKINGEWTTKRIKESTKAKLKSVAAEIAIANSQGIILPENYRLLDFISIYTQTYIPIKASKSTRTNYRLSFENINDFVGNPKLTQISPIQYQEFLNELGKHYARNTVETRHKKLRAMFNKAVSLKIIPFNPTHGAIMTGEDVTQKKIQFVDTHLITPLVNDITSSFSVARGMIFLAIQTGMRYGELAALSWFDIDFKNRVINVNKSWEHQIKEYVSTKNKERRKVYLDNTTIEYLRAYKKWFDSEFMNLENKLSLLFCTKNNNPLSNNGANKVLKESFRQLTGSTVTLHKLRHTHIVQCFEAGMDIIYVSERAGHKDINTTMKYYNHVSSKIRTLNENRTSEQFAHELSILKNVKM